MMRTNGKIWAIAMVTMLQLGNQLDAQSAKQVKKIRQVAEEMRIKTKVPGLAMAIYKDGEVLISEGFGKRDLERDLPVTTETVFSIASVSKAFMTASIGVLVDEGKMDWEEPVKTYLPDFQLKDPVATENATLLDLATHQVGLPRHDNVWYNASYTRKELFDRLKYLEPSKTFRGGWQYQNLMYTTAGYAVGKVAGATWEEAVKTRLLDPLKMSSTYFSVDETTSLHDYALPYREKEDEIVPGEYRNVDAIGPAGSITSNVEDMMKWVRFHLKDTLIWNEDILSATQLDKMHAAHTIIGKPSKHSELTPANYGLAWFVYYYHGYEVVQHGGNLEGFTSLVYLIPEENIGMVFLTNKSRSKLPGILAMYVSDILLSTPKVDWYGRVMKEEDKKEEEKEEKEPVAGTSYSHQWETYVGKFEHPGYGVIEIEEDTDSTLLTNYNGFTFQTKHWHYDIFQGVNEAYDEKYFLNFRTNVDGEIETIELQLEPSVAAISFKKSPPGRLDNPEFLSLLVGNYEAEDLPIEIAYKSPEVIQIMPKGQQTFELEPYRGTEYRFKGLNGYSIEFILNAEETNVLEAKLHQPNGIFNVRKLEH